MRCRPPAGWSVRRAGLAALGAGAVLTACARRGAMLPSSPLDLEDTPPAGRGGVIFTPTPTPGPSPTPSVAPTVVVDPPEPLQLAPGLRASVYAEAVGPVERLAVAPNGDVFAALPRENRIVALPDRNRDGYADGVTTWWDGAGLNGPDGLAFWSDTLWVANEDGLARFPYHAGDVTALAPPTTVVPLPSGGRVRGRSLAVNRQGQLFLGVGASCNACVEDDIRRATVLRVDAETGRTQRYSSGLRAPSGIAVDPGSGEVWVTDRARDDLGDATPPDELNRLGPGAEFGWPFCVGAQRPDPQLGATLDICRATQPPALTFPPHFGVRGAAFYRGAMFPAEYDGGLFVASHGSEVQLALQAYKVLFVPFRAGAPTGEVRDVAAGWMKPDTRLWGRPVDVVVAPDGALLVADEAGRRVFRLIYAPHATPTPPLY